MHSTLQRSQHWGGLHRPLQERLILQSDRTAVGDGFAAQDDASRAERAGVLCGKTVGPIAAGALRIASRPRCRKAERPRFLCRLKAAVSTRRSR